ncbi:MAG: hypothetical protein DDT26_01886 [Dehalococcoidia bacterium]|nr:hypothetical protein [Chloroflexota bacterium]MBT9166504.1 hypothetical protein [Chloroflexota bacterium]
MRDREYLFSNTSWHDVERLQLQEMQKAIAAMDGNQLLNTSVEDLVLYFESKFQIEIPTLLTEKIVVDQRETQIDVSRDHNHMIYDRSRPFHIAGTEIEVEIPFTGEAEAFKIQPTTYTTSPPRAEVRGSLLVLKIVGTNLEAERVRSDIDRTVNEIQSHLTTLRGNAQGLRTQLPTQARSAIESRRQKLLGDRNLVGGLGFKMKPRPGTNQTFTAPEVRKKLAPSLPAESTLPYKPEPALSNADYEHILGVLQNMVQVMERSPSAFETMDEESIRSHFLVQLNGHYEGQATGETFNYEGKTDILVRSEGKNIFIGECKFWSGPKMLTETIDQVLGYTSWRDTKVAVIVFNRNKDFSRVLGRIVETAKAHTNFKRELSGSTETTFRYCFSHKDDKNRELFLTVLAFDVPQSDSRCR